MEKQSNKTTFESDDRIFESVNEQLIHETKSMAKFAMAKGLKLSPAIIVSIKQFNGSGSPTQQQIKSLVNNHNSLVLLIKPALPKNVVYLEQREKAYAERKNRWASKFPMLRKLFVFSLIATLALITSSLSSSVSHLEIEKGILNSSGWGLLVNFFFICSAAAIGASFLVLSNIKSKFTDGTYHPDQDGGFWITILLGIIGGIIMSEIIPISATTGSDDIGMNKLLYALLGGFSSKLIYNVLNKLIVAVESLVAGSPESKANNDLEKAKNETDMQVSKVQLNVTGQLSALQNKIQQQSNSGDIKNEISNTINGIFEDLGVIDAPGQQNDAPASDPTPTPTPTPDTGSADAGTTDTGTTDSDTPSAG